MHTMKSNTLKNDTTLPLLRAAAGAAALASVLILASGCVVAVRPAPVVYEQPVAPGEVVVTEDPPAPIYETVGVAPGPGYLWIGGYYHWSGGGWVWYRGHYARPPHPGAAWVRARYEVRGGRRVYIAGYWR
jgi:cell wall-associated NlpC family hydrolase